MKWSFWSLDKYHRKGIFFGGGRGGASAEALGVDSATSLKQRTQPGQRDRVHGRNNLAPWCGPLCWLGLGFGGEKLSRLK